ncbi:AlbA family DNA-binding domain-containing protein [Tundrisphaera lichenicola]|uniref:AlbA family DNA-binding domain-containing protein n=1 Tax=Tundrisphaera lichenicola TaxID=2029860 RepID=UPI003EB9293B
MIYFRKSLIKNGAKREWLGHSILMNKRLHRPDEILANPSRDPNREGPFSPNRIDKIFSTYEIIPEKIKARENSHLEFKQAFSLGSLGKYAKTMAAFANADGGYIVFGITNSPHRLEGLKDTRFADIDPEKLTNFLNEHLAPEIRWEKHVHLIGVKEFGLIYVFSSREKPVLCKKNSNQERDDKPALKEGEIYYRYRGRSECIKYPELRRIIDDTRKQEQTLWMNHLKRIARIGVKNAGVFDLNSGEIAGAGGTFIIDESLLPSLSFIREGEFVEMEGTPALRLVGSVTPIEGSLLPSFRKVRVVETKAIHGPDLIEAFLKNERVNNPRQYIQQICHENSAFFPVYFFIRSAQLDIPAVINLVNDEVVTQQTKNRLIDRLTNDRSLSLPFPSGQGEGSQKKKLYVERLKSSGLVVNDVSQDDIFHALQAIRMLDRKTLDVKYIRGILLECFVKHYGKSQAVIRRKIEDNLRRAVCFLDAVLNRDAVTNIPK